MSIVDQVVVFDQKGNQLGAAPGPGCDRPDDPAGAVLVPPVRLTYLEAGGTIVAMRLTDVRPVTVAHATVASVGALALGTLRVLGGDHDPRGDARVVLSVDASPAQVWAALSDGEAYGDWVIGAKPVRGVDPDWPAAGAALYYAVGIGPLEIRDRTTVHSSESERLLDLDVTGPMGVLRVLVRLEPEATGRTLVHLDEHPHDGAARLLHTPVASAVFAARGAFLLHRLRALVEER